MRQYPGYQAAPDKILWDGISAVTSKTVSAVNNGLDFIASEMIFAFSPNTEDEIRYNERIRRLRQRQRNKKILKKKLKYTRTHSGSRSSASSSSRRRYRKHRGGERDFYIPALKEANGEGLEIAPSNHSLDLESLGQFVEENTNHIFRVELAPELDILQRVVEEGIEQTESDLFVKLERERPAEFSLLDETTEATLEEQETVGGTEVSELEDPTTVDSIVLDEILNAPSYEVLPSQRGVIDSTSALEAPMVRDLPKRADPPASKDIELSVTEDRSEIEEDSRAEVEDGKTPPSPGSNLKAEIEDLQKAIALVEIRRFNGHLEHARKKAEKKRRNDAIAEEIRHMIEWSATMQTSKSNEPKSLKMNTPTHTIQASKSMDDRRRAQKLKALMMRLSRVSERHSMLQSSLEMLPEGLANEDKRLEMSSSEETIDRDTRREKRARALRKEARAKLENLKAEQSKIILELERLQSATLNARAALTQNSGLHQKKEIIDLSQYETGSENVIDLSNYDDKREAQHALSPVPVDQ